MEIYHSGCNPYIGIMHELKQGHPALASDLMEEWRAPISDWIMLMLIQKEMLTAEDFHYLDDQSVYLKPKAKKIVLEHFAKKLNSRYSYESINGVKNDYKNAIKTQIYRLIHAIENEDATLYYPALIK